MNRVEHLLTKLTEEGLEVGQRACKAAEFGLHEVQPGQALDNAQRVIVEYIDFLGVMKMLVDEGHIVMPPQDQIKAGMEAKKLKVEKFILHAKACGTFQE